MVKLKKSFAPSEIINADTAVSVMRCSHFDPETIAHLPEHLRMSIYTNEIRDEVMIKNVIAQTPDVDMTDVGVMTEYDWPSRYKDYKNLQAHNYSKHEQPFIPNATKEEALKNAEELIDSEKKARAIAERKEAKKKRRKERKKAEKPSCDDDKNANNNTTNLKDVNSAASLQTNGESDDHENYDNNENLVCSKSEEQIDTNAAFVQGSVKRNKNMSTSTNSSLSSKSDKVNLSATSGAMPKTVKQKFNKMSHERAEKLAIHGCQLALNYNDFNCAIDQLTQAIFHAPDDIRHHLNRSYCYLRLGQYTSALSDAKFAKERAQSMEVFVKAVVREGQALCGLRQYHEAEKCFEEAMKLEQGNKWVLGELILVRTLQLTSMGFSKINALKALQQCSTVADAVTLLTSENMYSPELETNGNESEIKNTDGDEIYFSDNESSNSFLLSKLVSTLADESCYFENLQLQSSSSKVQQCASYSERTMKSSSSMESIIRGNEIKISGNAQWELSGGSKQFQTISKTKNQKIIQSDSSSIWVGNIESKITDIKLRESFSKFGPINYIRRFSDKRYVFIDFKTKKAATKALNSTIDIEVCGIKLPIKRSTGGFVKN